MSVQYLSPDGLHQNPAFSQVVSVEGPHRTVYVGGQNAVDSDGNIVGAGDVGAQGEQVARNVLTALAAAGAGPEHVVKWTIYLVYGHPAVAAFGGFQREWPDTANAPAIVVLQVAALANPSFLVEVEAVAAVPLER